MTRDENTLTELAADMWDEGARPTQRDYDRASELLGFTVAPNWKPDGAQQQ